MKQFRAFGGDEGGAYQETVTEDKAESFARGVLQGESSIEIEKLLSWMKSCEIGDEYEDYLGYQTFLIRVKDV